MAPVRLRYFGPFAAFGGEEPLRFPVRATARLLAILALDPARERARAALAAHVWPEADPDRRAASLRNGLTLLRATLGADAVIADRETVRLAVPVESDWGDARRLRRIVESASDEETLSRARAGLVALADAELLEGWEAPWIAPLRAEHARALARAATELGRARFEAGAFREAREHAIRALRLVPRSESALILAIRASVALEEERAALKLIETYSARFGGVPPAIAELVRDLRTGRARPLVELSRSLRGPLEEALAEALDADPDTAVRFLLPSPDGVRRRRDLESTKRLLRMALERPLSPGTRRKALLALVALAQRTSDYAEALHFLCEIRAEGDSPDAEETRLSAENLELLVLLETRRWSEAETLAGRIVAATPRDSFANIAARMSLAGCLWHQGRTEEGRILYEEIAGGEPDELVLGFTHGNLACLATAEGDWEAVEREARIARDLLSSAADVLYSAFPIALHALGRLGTGREAAPGEPDALRELAGSLLLPAEMGSRRLVQCLVDYAAEGFALSGRGGAALALLQAGARLRAEIGHFRSPAEEAVADRIRSRAEGSRRGEEPPIPTGGESEYVALARWTIARAETPGRM